MWRTLVSSVLLALGVLAATASMASEPGQDHPLVNRYPGSVILHYDHREFEEAQIFLSKPYRQRDGSPTVDRLLPLEGEVTYLHYRTPDSSSSLQVFRNYQSVLKRSGFRELFVCERPCSDINVGNLKHLMKARDLYFNGSTENQYIAAQQGNTYVALWVNRISDAGADVWMLVVDKQGLDDGKIGVSGTGAIAKALNERGRADVYGFHFDTGKALLRGDSQGTLRELATVLQDNPTLKIDVIGHTDDVGAADANQTLSEARANAVAGALTGQYGIAADRLTASGSGSSQPLASNSNEAGRAKNRRVEIVAHNEVPAAAPVSRRTSSTQGGTASTGQSGGQGSGEGGGLTLETAKQAIETVKQLKSLFGR